MQMRFVPAIVGVAGLVSAVAGCGGDDDSNSAAAVEPASTTAAPETSTTVDSTPDAATESVAENGDEPGEPEPTTPADENVATAVWAVEFVDAFKTYQAEFAAQDDQLGRDLSTAETVADQVAARLVRMTAWTASLEQLAEALPSDVDPSISTSLEAFETAHQSLQAQVAVFADEVGADTEAIVAELDEILAADDGEGPQPDLSETRYRQLLDPTEALLEQWWAACLDLRRAAADAGAERIECGEPDEPLQLPDVTLEPTHLQSDAVPIEPGEHRLEYFQVPVTLTLNETVLARSSHQILELTPSLDAPTVRIHLNDGLVGNPLELGPTVVDNWPITGDLDGWIGALPVTLDGTGTGTIAGLDAEYWDVTSEADTAIAILNGGDELLFDTQIAPGESMRIWLVSVNELPIVVTEQAPDGMDRLAIDAALASLYDAIQIG